MTTRAFIVSVVILCSVATTPLAARQPRPAPAALARAVDSLAARIVSSGVTPGLGVAIVMDGKAILAKGYGWADPAAHTPATERTLWYVASTSKSYAGFGIALLVHQRSIGLSTPITMLLAGVQWPDGVDASRLTLAHFLSHTHHLNDDAVVQSAAFTGAFPEAEWPNLIRYATPSGNDDLVYSNFGYNVAAMVIDRLRPEGWRRYLDSAVYRPAGMRETYARVSGLDPRRIAKPHDLSATGEFVALKFEKTDATMNSAGGHLATLHDLARWVIVLMDSGKIDGRQVFPPAAVALSHRVLARHTVESSKRFGPFEREGWAAGWDIGSYMGEPMVSRFGGYSSFRSHLSMLPGRRIGVVAQVNGPGASRATDLLAAFAYDLEAGRATARAVANARLDSLIARLPVLRQQSARSDSVRRSRQRPLRRPLADFAGSYFNEAFGTLVFSDTSGMLRYRWGVLEGPTEVYDAGSDQLRIEVVGSGQVAAFQFDGPGVAKLVELGRITFVRR
jgi:CubicO group peptidase (beta-lactamase class C family)